MYRFYVNSLQYIGLVFRIFFFTLIAGLLLSTFRCSAGTDMKVVGYYAGNTVPFDSIELSSLTHIIYCFGKLCGDGFCLRNHADTAAIEKLVGLKKQFPRLKVMLSLGGWGGCETCSEVFSSEQGRRDFAGSVRAAADYFHIDGLDLDWEYPVVKGFPGHRYALDDKKNFTALLEEIRKSNEDDFLLTFAAGGFTDYIDSAVDWKAVVPLVDFVNVMSYDLVHGYSNVSGHHTPLFSTPYQRESTDHAVGMLRKAGVPPRKIIIGAAFYARVFRIKEGFPVDLYQPCAFDHTFQYRSAEEILSEKQGFELRFDSVAFAPYAVNNQKRMLATFDDPVSIAGKVRYVSNGGLGGIMFWQLCDDKSRGGLLEIIKETMPGD